MERARELAETLHCTHWDLIPNVRDNADIVFLAVTDTAVAALAGKLRFEHGVLVHTAGAVAIDTLAEATKDRGVIWPVYSIVKTDLPNHRNIPCAWEASTGKAKALLLVAGDALTDVLFEAKDEQRKWLHLSAVMGNNFVNHLLTICEQVCVDNDLPFTVLMPILEQTFDRIRHASPVTVQTGPAIRGDAPTIQNQINMLAEHPRWQRVYEAITASIEDTYRK
jgi:predicted short-subunit dehydrogenase-like oxidoreductase (DUF2520 family)